MGVPVALVTLAVRGVDRHIGGHSVACHQFGREALHQYAPSFSVQL